MRKSGKSALAFWLCVLFLAGCGEGKVPDVVEVPTVAIGKEGNITVWQVGEFDKPYYNLAELTNMAVREAQEYNAAKGKEAVVVEKTEMLGDGVRVVVSYRFDGWESCTEFGGEHIFYGTVQEAAAKGFGTDVILRNVKDNTLLTETQLKSAEGQKLVITDIKANVYCPGMVTHISDGAAVNGDGSVDAAGLDGLVYILLK